MIVVTGFVIVAIVAVTVYKQSIALKAMLWTADCLLRKVARPCCRTGASEAWLRDSLRKGSRCS